MIMAKMPSERRFAAYADKFSAFAIVAEECGSCMGAEETYALRHLWDGFVDVVYLHGPATAAVLVAAVKA